MKLEKWNDKTAYQNIKLKKDSSCDKNQLEARMIMYDTQKRWGNHVWKNDKCTFHIKLFWINYNQNKILASMNAITICISKTSFLSGIRLNYCTLPVFLFLKQ